MAAPMENTLKYVFNNVFTVIEKPEDFLVDNKANSGKFSQSVKKLYDTSHAADTGGLKSTEALPELIVKGFDDEQIWQQLELENNGSVQAVLAQTAKLLSLKTPCSFKPRPQTVQSSNRPSSKTTRSKAQKRKGGKKSDEDVALDTSDLDDVDNEDLLADDQDNFSEERHSDIEDNLDSDNDLDDEDEGEEGEEFDKNDKFFDFTGDSDEDLNYDFGPLSSKGDLDNQLFDKSDESGDEDGQGKGKKSKTKKKKSVKFEDDINLQKENKKQKLTKFAKDRLNKVKQKGSVVDDAFFKLAELEAFLDSEDRKEERRLRREERQLKGGTNADSSEDEDDDDQEEEVDLFADLGSEDEDLHYEDFFDPPDGDVEGRDGNDEEDDESEDDEDDDERNQEENDDDDDDDSDDGEDDNDDDDASPDQNIVDLQPGKRQLLADSDSEGEDVADILGGARKQQKSSFEIRQDKLAKRISELEEGMLEGKAWQMAGEVEAGKRPENSLLQENLQFDYTSRLPPEITEETTKTLEDIIKQRVKDKAWDDVERKVKPKENLFEYKKRITLDEEKSKLSLGEIYEQEYIKQQQTEEVEKKDPDHDEIKKMMTSLFIKLDALSNFHYTPKQAAAEVQIITNQPSITMEEVAPVATSNAQLLAPEEIKDKVTGELKGDTEKSKTDKLRERQKKKKVKRIKQKERDQRAKLVEKLNPGLGNKYSKERAIKALEKESKGGQAGLTLLKNDKKSNSGVSSSKAFFTQLQDEVTSHVNSKKAEKRKKVARDSNSAKKFKL